MWRSSVMVHFVFTLWGLVPWSSDVKITPRVTQTWAKSRPSILAFLEIFSFWDSCGHGTDRRNDETACSEGYIIRNRSCDGQLGLLDFGSRTGICLEPLMWLAFCTLSLAQGCVSSLRWCWPARRGICVMVAGIIPTKNILFTVRSSLLVSGVLWA